MTRRPSRVLSRTIFAVCVCAWLGLMVGCAAFALGRDSWLPWTDWGAPHAVVHVRGEGCELEDFRWRVVGEEAWRSPSGGVVMSDGWSVAQLSMIGPPFVAHDRRVGLPIEVRVSPGADALRATLRADDHRVVRLAAGEATGLEPVRVVWGVPLF